LSLLEHAVNDFLRHPAKFPLLLLALLGVVCVSAMYWSFEGHGTSLSSLAKIHTGMTRREVIDLLGKSSTVNRHSDGSESWYYTRGTFCIVRVHSDEKGEVRETDHDH
jgi:outer membrane protein assembly factor BamE (lipoprotein component of BamABCDE complex)